MTDKLKEAEAIASDLAGFPVGIRFIPPEPPSQTGYPFLTNVVGSEFAHQLRNKLNGTGTISFHESVEEPQEWRQGLDDLLRRGIVVITATGRLWTTYAMPDPAMRRLFNNWGLDHQDRESPEWEGFFDRALRDKKIRIK